MKVAQYPERLGFDAARLRRIDAWMARYVDAGKLPGAATLVARHGEVVHHAWIGRRDVEAGEPWTPDTLLRIYSMTKPVTTVGLMMLFEEGRFRLDDPVADYIPELGDLAVLRCGAQSIDEVEPLTRPITIHHLLTHTAGFTYGFNGGVLGAAYEAARIGFGPGGRGLEAEIRRLATMPLAFQPGARWNYGVSTDVAGRLVEVLSGQPLDRYLNERVLAPLDMNDTGFACPAAKRARLASLYGRGEAGGMVRIESGAESAFLDGRVRTFSGGGGLISTIGDYARFAEMLRGGGVLDRTRLLGPRTVRFMTRNHLPGDLAAMGQPVFAEISFAGIGFGLGFWSMLDPARAQVPGNPGDYGWGGRASTVFMVDPAEDMVVLFLTQLAPSSTYPLRSELRALVHQALIDEPGGRLP